MQWTHVLKSNPHGVVVVVQPLIYSLGKQRQADLSDLEARLVYKVNSRTGRNVTQRNPISKKQNKATTTNPIYPHLYALCLHFMHQLKNTRTQCFM